MVCRYTSIEKGARPAILLDAVISKNRSAHHPLTEVEGRALSRHAPAKTVARSQSRLIHYQKGLTDGVRLDILTFSALGRLATLYDI